MKSTREWSIIETRETQSPASYMTKLESSLNLQCMRLNNVPSFIQYLFQTWKWWDVGGISESFLEEVITRRTMKEGQGLASHSVWGVRELMSHADRILCVIVWSMMWSRNQRTLVWRGNGERWGQREHQSGSVGSCKPLERVLDCMFE